MNKEIKDIRIVFSIFALVFGFVFYKHYPKEWSYIFALLSFSLLFLSVFYPESLKPLLKLWLKATHILGKINTTIILSLLFFFVFIPMGTVMKLLGNDPLKKKKEELETYWEEYKLSGLVDKNRYERQF